jgi:nitrogen PTS system EIIA component
MRLCDILSADRILVDERGDLVATKERAVHLLAHLLSPAIGVEQDVVETFLIERENLQSTGIGDGVAIPHTSVDQATKHAAALLLCPRGVDFESIDGEKVNIIFGLVGPKSSAGDHLRTLARISRLLRDQNTRANLVQAGSPGSAFQVIETQEATMG